MATQRIDKNSYTCFICGTTENNSGEPLHTFNRLLVHIAGKAQSPDSHAKWVFEMHPQNDDLTPFTINQLAELIKHAVKRALS